MERPPDHPTPLCVQLLHPAYFVSEEEKHVSSIIV